MGREIYPLCGIRYASSQVAENPTSSAEQVPTSQPSAPKEVPLTIDSHGPITQNPNHTKKVSSTKSNVVDVVITGAGR